MLTQNEQQFNLRRNTPSGGSLAQSSICPTGTPGRRNLACPTVWAEDEKCWLPDNSRTPSTYLSVHRAVRTHCREHAAGPSLPPLALSRLPPAREIRLQSPKGIRPPAPPKSGKHHRNAAYTVHRCGTDGRICIAWCHRTGMALA